MSRVSRKESDATGVSRVSRKETDANGRARGVGVGVGPMLLALMSVILGLLVSKYGIEYGNEVVRRKATEIVETLRKLVSSRVGGSDAKGELWSADGWSADGWSADGTTKRFYLLPNGENDGEEGGCMRGWVGAA